MNTLALAKAARTRSEWWIPAGLIALSLVPALAGSARVAELASGAPITEANARFVAMPTPVVLHLLAAIPFSMIGAFQFMPGFRQRHPQWHRAAGKALVVLGLLVAMSGLWMTQFYPWPPGDGVALYVERLVFGTGLVGCIGLALDAIRRRDYAAHGEWMSRGFAIALGAGTQVLTHLPYFLLVGRPGEVGRGVMMGAGWVINLAVAEWIIQRGAALRHAARASPLNASRIVRAKPIYPAEHRTPPARTP